MRPLSLVIEGFTTFRERQEIDFEPLELFVITGPTGAGKTSILDAMVFALYGEVPRLGGQRGTSDIVALGDMTAAVQFEFSIDGKGRHRVARRVSRRANVAQTATLERREGSDWKPLAEGGVRDCNQKIAELIGLNFDAFTRAVVLPQGEFHRFLKGDVAERRQVLFALLGVSYFQRMAATAGTRRRALEAAVQRTEELLGEQYADATAEHLAELKVVAAGAADALTSISQAVTSAAEQSEIAASSGRRATALATSAGELTVVAADLHTGAEGLRAAEVGHTDALAEVNHKADALKVARDAVGAAEAALRQSESEVGTLGDLADAATAAKTLAEAASEEQTAAGELADAKGELERASAALDTANGSEASLAAQLSDAKACAEAAAAHAATTTGNHDTIARQLTATTPLAQDLADADATLAQLHRSLPELRAEASDRQEELGAAIRRLEEHRRLHAVAELVEGLQAGAPCPVCGGALAAPPAVPPDEAEALDAARAGEESARKTAAERERALTAAETRLSNAETARADRLRRLTEALAGYSDLASLCDAADLADGSAATAAAESSALEEARAVLETQHQVAQAAVTQARLALNSTEGDVRTAQTKIDGIQQRRTSAAELLKARFAGEIPADAAAQIANQRARLEAAGQALESARAAADERTEEHEKARELAAESERELVQIDQALTKARTRAEAASTAAAATPAEVELGHPPDPTASRETTSEQLGTWCTEAANTLTSAHAQTVAEREQASGVVITLAQAHGIEAQRVDQALVQLKLVEQSAVRHATVAQAAVEECERRIAERTAMEEQAKEEREQIALLASLARELREDRFGEYIVQETIGLLSAHASEELKRISGGRYSLCPAGDEFQVVDHHNADERRSVKTLSGGETFLASLALALALSRHVGDLASQGMGAKLESVFIDEGFGTLDPATLDEVIDALERLRAEDLVVGVISHVPELAQRIQSGLTVQEVDGHSRIVPTGVE